MKRIFILTGEASGDKLASSVVANLQKNNPSFEYLSVGGDNLKSLGIKSIYDLKEITYLGFTDVILNIFKINRKINETVNSIIEYKPDLLFTVDSPDFTLRVAEKVKKINSNIKTVHYVAPQVWVWRKNRVKKIKKFIDHILLLFDFEKPYFDKEHVSNEFVGHPLLIDKAEEKIDLNQIIGKNKPIISVYPGSRKSEIEILTPILLKFVKLMNTKYTDFIYVFHSTQTFNDLIRSFIKSENSRNCEVISDDKIKSHILKKSIFAIAKSGTVSLEICNAKVPSIIIYKMGIINFFIIKMLVKTRFANIINIAANEEIIPELLQSNCNSNNILKKVTNFIENPDKIKTQIDKTQTVLNKLKTDKSSSELAANSIIRILQN
jgi:lipid-A-disaccharide synthase